MASPTEPRPPAPSYPAPAFLNFCPGGISAKGGEAEWYDLASYPTQSSSSQSSQRTIRRKSEPPDVLVAKARQADDRLRQYALLYGKDPTMPHHLPSLSVLAGAAFGRLTGVGPTMVKAWADAMVLHYLDDRSPETVPASEQEIYDVKEPSSVTVQESASVVLKRLLQESEASVAGTCIPVKARPCGYVFKRGDIAWNCRTCQTDPTCVICDTCFHSSNHEGHEVYFHRTTPGGCCDCGDAEAWKVEGCCPLHRPAEVQHSGDNDNDPEEAVKMALRGLKEGLDTLQQPPTKLPPKFASALGVVIGAAVNCLVDAVDGAGIGADPVQWNIRWADEICRILNGNIHDDECYNRPCNVTPEIVLNDPKQQYLFPTGYNLELRLHNDDVHTFEEVIEALHEPRHRRNSEDNSVPLVSRREDANEMTHHVDGDGQVTVKSYNSFKQAMQGYRQLKSKGLHCAVVSCAQVDMENRARALTSWLTEIAASHPAAAVILVHALVQVGNHDIGGIPVWLTPRTIPPWASIVESDDESTTCRRRFFAFPPHMESSFVTREEAEKLHFLAMQLSPPKFKELTGTDPTFYETVPYRLPPRRYRKSPHALWGSLPSMYTDTTSPSNRHPLLYRITTGQFDSTAATMKSQLTEAVFVIDTDIRKQQESELLLSSLFAHKKIPGLHMISGVGTIRTNSMGKEHPPIPNPMEWRNLLAGSSFRAPASPIVSLLLLDPYPTKQLRSSLHALFLSLLVDSRFKCRFAAALGAIAYRPLSTLFCAGVGTEADTPLGFTVQIFTAGSLVRALANASATEKLLKSDQASGGSESGAPIGIFTIPIAHAVLRCIHTNLLGSTTEVNMILKNTPVGATNENPVENGPSEELKKALTYQAGEHPLSVLLPAAPDDGFLDSRSTRHKRLPHLLRDLEYVMETTGTAYRLLLPQRYPIHNTIARHGSSPPSSESFATVYARLLRMAQGMDPQKRKISGGHVEYEQQRWLEAFGLSLNFAGTRDALSESLTNACSSQMAPFASDGSHLQSIREAMGNLFVALLRELKLWLYREGMLETLPVPPGRTHGGMDHSQIEALQRSTLHISSSQLFDLSEPYTEPSTASTSPTNSTIPTNGSQLVTNLALSCATGVKMSEAQLELVESALRHDGLQRQLRLQQSMASKDVDSKRGGLALGDWLRIPHSPLGGDALSFHLPLHRALAKCVRSICYVPVPDSVRRGNSAKWWKLPILDDEYAESGTDQLNLGRQHPLAAVIRPVLRPANCRVVWASGPDCTRAEAQQRRSRLKSVSANIASAKIIHSLADHPLRCMSAAQQIERHLWARNGSSTAGMALNYSSAPLCRSFRDLDLTLVQLSASGFNVGLGARRVFALLISRFSMDGYLCDPEKRVQGGGSSPSFASGNGGWVNPPRLQDSEHAVALSESFFTTLCVLVTELPPPPPLSPADNSALRSSLRRELLHALAAEPRSHSEAIEAATSASSRRDESAGISGGGSGGGALGDVFTEVLREVGKQKTQASSRAASGPSAYELRAECCGEYDPTFFHLRRQDHQHAMDNVARLRKQKVSQRQGGNGDGTCLPLVCAPPKSHPRFLPSRLLLHLPAMDAAIRRYLMFAMTGGSWLPPAKPLSAVQDLGEGAEQNDMAVDSGDQQSSEGVPVTMFTRRSFQRQSSVGRKAVDGSDPSPFSSSVVAESSVSILEVLQLLTLQVHTLEECAALHRMLPDLDAEAKLTSAGLSINSYLGRLVRVPPSLADEWAFAPAPRGPLASRGSGENIASILGMLIALYEHRSKQGGREGSRAGAESGGDDGHGGARSLAESGLQWILRFVNALVDGASSVSAAARSASSGIPIKSSQGTDSSDVDSTSWTIAADVRSKIMGMLSNLPELWPAEEKAQAMEESNSTSAKSREARKAAQKRVMEMMKRKQNAFAATLAPADGEGNGNKMEVDQDESDLCIICRCDDADGENNGPLGYLGHVQRSRYAQMRSTTESKEGMLHRAYRVVGHRGCQLRKTEAMDSDPLVCLPTGSIVTVLSNTVSEKYDVLSRRVFVRHVANENSPEEEITEGWASVQSSEGYVILSPLYNMCYSNTRWGSTRPIIRLCGHAAHLRCVETHTLSLHHRAAGDQPYDGRFAANIDDGEFLCPLCKQLSNILIPGDACVKAGSRTCIIATKSKDEPEPEPNPPVQSSSVDSTTLRGALTQVNRRETDNTSDVGRTALRRYGDQLMDAMTVPWERANSAKKRKQQRWHKAIQRWDYDDDSMPEDQAMGIKDLMSRLRQQHIAWAALGHSAATGEASTRNVEDVTPFGIFSQTTDPWADFNVDSRDNHPMLLELRRTLAATAGLYEVLMSDVSKAGANGSDQIPIVGSCLADVLDGNSWLTDLSSSETSDKKHKDQLVSWSQLTALISSMPSHVARDGMLSQRHEARAVAAAMWCILGHGTQRNESEGDRNTLPPVPLAIRLIQMAAVGSSPSIPEQWGTTDCYLSKDDDTKARPFRPGVAAAFLYTPLLAWDMNTLAGAVFTTMTASGTGLRAADLLVAARTIIVGRMVQVMTTPNGCGVGPDDDDEDQLLDHWTENDVKSEGTALSRLFSICKEMVESRSLRLPELKPAASVDGRAAVYHGAIGRAILPLARSVVLMLRASSSVVRQRQKRLNEPAKKSPEDNLLDSIIVNDELMTLEDGILILKAIGGPLPSQIVDDPQHASWLLTIKRWLVAVVGFDLHHGSRGSNVISFVDPSTTFENERHSSQSHNANQLEMKAMDTDEDENADGLMSDDQDDGMGDGGVGGLQQSQVDRDHHESLDDEMDETDAVDMGRVDDMDVDNSEEEMVDFEEQQVLGLLGRDLAEASRNSPAADNSDDNSDESCSTTAPRGPHQLDDRTFACVSRSPIIPYQPSLLGVEEIGAGTRGAAFEVKSASAVMCDLSHLGMIHRKDTPTKCLVRLPKSFVELYGLVNKVKGRDSLATIDDPDDGGSTETAICLLTGGVMRSGAPRRSYSRVTRPPGACTMHARQVGSGIGVFFLVQKCTVLLMHNNKSAYSPSLYVDQHGEEDPGLRRGRPLFLNEARYRALETLWRQQGIPREVAQIRSTSDRVIRDNWY